MANLPLSFAELMAGGILLVAGYKGATPGEVINGEDKKALSFAGAPGSKAAGTPNAPGPGAGSATSAGGVSARAGSIVHYLTQNGLSPVAAAGVVGNLQQESSLNPSTPGGGLAQWIGSRWSALQAYAAAHGLSPNSEQAQLEYLVQDLHGDYRTTLAAMNAAATPQQAATIFSDQYERPGIPDLSNRQTYAQQAYTAAGY